VGRGFSTLMVAQGRRFWISAIWPCEFHERRTAVLTFAEDPFPRLIPKGRANGKPRIVSENAVNRRLHRRNEFYILREGGEGEM